jgi:hypothetical protein
VPAWGTNDHVRYLHWMHFAEGTLMLHLVARLYLGRVGDAAKTVQARVEGMIGDQLDLVEVELTRGGHMAGARAGGDHQEETSSERVPAYAATDLVAEALRETTAETSGCGRRANRNQPRILQATESIRVLTGHY